MGIKTDNYDHLIYNYRIESADFLLFRWYKPVVHRFWSMVKVENNRKVIPLKELHGLATQRKSNQAKIFGHRIIGDKIATYEYSYDCNQWYQLSSPYPQVDPFNSWGFYHSKRAVHRQIYQQGLSQQEAEQIWTIGIELGVHINQKNIPYEPFSIFRHNTNSNSVHYTLGKAMGVSEDFFRQLDFYSNAPGNGLKLV